MYGVLNIVLQVTSMDNVTDTLFIGFVVRPEWDVSKALDPARIEVEVIASQHIKQHAVYQQVVADLRQTIQEQVAFRHVYTYHKRLRAVTPGYGYAVDRETGRLRDNEIELADHITPPPSIVMHTQVVSTARKY